MPQIAQQDYLRILPAAGRSLTDDAGAMLQLFNAYLRGTAYDCDVVYAHGQDHGQEYELSGRVVGTGKRGEMAGVIIVADNRITPITFELTTQQYEGLRAVQEAHDAKYGLEETLPQIVAHTDAQGAFLYDSSGDTYICVDDYLLAVEYDDHDISAITPTTQRVPDDADFVNISYEDSQKLTGFETIE